VLGEMKTYNVLKQGGCDPTTVDKDVASPAPGSCYDLGAIAFDMGPLTITQPTQCTAVNTSPAPTPLATKLACTYPAAQATSCGTGKVCVPDPAPGDRVCVLVDPGGTCPAGYASHTSFYTQWQDDRSCGCSCGAPTPITCAGAGIDLYSGLQCGGFEFEHINVNVTCSKAAMAALSGRLKGGDASSSCPGIANDTGAVTPKGASTTLCCPM
jgi:hypothetical protein